ncbi:hypothetical protein [Hyphomicrobium sp. CS1GBMeth3]|uniref:hypothetical protein n=1 Tax=Hyphomicrobium sp. CS1GBMeth3 TaxID=1892845 RepID=UPI000A54C373|nr:hypothetical protein [Hyphomicrobium sp. CS1GBMeth3]
MRKLIAMAVLGASAALFSVATTAPAQAVTAAGAGIAKSAAPGESAVQEVRKRRWKRHRHYHRHRYHRHRHWHGRRYYRPYYYGGYYPYYYRPYRRRPRIGIYFGI